MQDKIHETARIACLQAVQAITILEKRETQEFIVQAARMIADTFQQGGKVLLAGNGGSLCDAMHAAEELTGQFRKYRQALPAIALADPGHITCVSNDMGFQQIFSRGVEAFGRSGDLFIALTTSGNSENIVLALKTAEQMGLQRIALLGKGGGKSAGLSDLELSVDGFSTSDRIQEVHMACLHIIIELVEEVLFEKSS